MFRKNVLLFIMLLLVLSPISPSLVSAESGNEVDFTEDELKDNDYVLYFVNAGHPDPTEINEADKKGLYTGNVEQVYGKDEDTGKRWGLVTETTNTSGSDKSNKYETFRYYNGEQKRDKAIQYKFELPEGEYDITVGFKNPWSGRSVNIIANDQNLLEDYNIGDYGTEKEETFYQVSVMGNELDLKIQGPSEAELSNYNDPLINYIVVRKSVTIPISDVEDLLKIAKAKIADSDKYTPHSIKKLNEMIVVAEEQVNRVEEGIDETTIQAEIREIISDLENAIEGLMESINYESFKPGEKLLDTDGEVIQAHGGGVMYDEKTETYYWYGEDKTHGYLPTRGIRVYSSKDLYNWDDEGLALTAIENMDQFENDPLISEIYKDRDDKEAIFNDIGTQRVVERPKVIYNEEFDNYVMWFHADGPTSWSDANYAKAHAGYAISDSPTGPFVYQESNRLDRAPEDAEFNGQPDQPGMARDMTLFKDDDGTAYIIYASEENYTLYISKLNESYTDVVGWYKDGGTERDESYKGVYGEDYVRVFPGTHREAPAMFKYNDKYYLITSGSTGWDPNRAQYTVADDIFGEWKEMRDPSIGDKASTTFDSQSTFVIPVDPANGKFIYMGDRWKKNELHDSRYIWLPIEFGSDDEIILKWYDEWTLDTLDQMFRVNINTELTERVAVGEAPELPSTVNISIENGETLDTKVDWKVNPEDFNLPGTVEITGTLPAYNNKTISTDVIVIPDNVVYFVNAGGTKTSDYLKWTSYMTNTLMNTDVLDQKYDPDNGDNWGYLGDGTAERTNGDLFSSLRYLTSGHGDDITYNFELDDGTYTVYTGFSDPWFSSTGGSRKIDILINDDVKTEDFYYTDGYDVFGYDGIEILDGLLDVTIKRAGNSPDPQISWIIISKDIKEDGSDGEDGNDGTDGEDGNDGAGGEDGNDGTDGEDGNDGTDGEDGNDGTDGEDGNDGTDGEDGNDGTDGEDGNDGTDGENGNDGADGGDGTSSKDDVVEPDDNKQGMDNKLPNTATSIFNYMLIGLVLLFAGSIFTFIQIRKKA